MRRDRGMTMIEVMVAMLVATVGLLGGLAMIGSVMGGSSFARHASEAQVLAQSRLEQLQSLAGVKTSPTTPADTGAFGSPPVFVTEAAGTLGGVAQPTDSTGVSNTANTALNIFVREVAWQTDPGAFVGLPRRTIIVRVCWYDGAVPSPAACTPGRGYHEVQVMGVRLP